jgi:prepilin-type N-terminal cleavage/methylation domain-containing protein
MNRKLNRIKDKGFSMIELMVTLGILSIMGFAFTSIVINSNKEMKALEQKADALTLRANIEGTLSNLPVCTCNLVNNASVINVDALGTTFSDVGEIKSSCAVGASTVVAGNAVAAGTQLEVDNIKIENIESLGVAENYKAKMNIRFKLNSNNIRAIKPITLNVHFKTDSTTPTTAKKITECSFVAGSSGVAQISGSCPEGQYLRGFENGEMICSAVEVVVPAGGGAVASNDNSSTGKTYSLTNPGPGCRGDMCRTKDYGPCRGDMCRTNGASCTGDMCVATNGP